MWNVTWTPAQEKAISHTGSDIIISAAAGSGKSATLTERIIRKIKNGGDISRMLIVTFTKAATGELKSKITNALGKALAENPSSKHIQEQIIRVGSSDICTIDSFCMKLVKPNFDKLSLDADFRIGETTEIDILERDTMAEVLDDLYESDNRDKDFLLVADCYSSIWSESELGKSLLALRSKLLSTSDGLEMLLKTQPDTDDFFDTSFGFILKRHIYEALDYFIPVFCDAIADFKSDDKGEKYATLFANELDFLERLKRGLDSKKRYDEIKEIVNSISFPTMLSSKLKDSNIPLSFYKDTRRDLEDLVLKLQDDFFMSSEAGIKSSIKQNSVMCKAIYNILKKFEEALLRKKRLFSVYSFNDISNFALKLLYDENGNISSLANDIASKYDEIYIDEYQDTNSVQDKIFLAISRNNRFMVGDIKQSIYRFRSAEPEIFSYYRTNFDKSDSFNESSSGLSIFMSNNFRCDKEIISFSNLISNNMFLNSSGIPYEKSDELIYSKNLPSDYNHASTQVCLFDTKGLGRGSGAKYEAEYVASRIKSMIDNEYLPNGEKIRPSHIAILLRNYKSNHKLYIDALEKYGVSARYEIAEGFFEKPHIQLINCVLNAIDNPSRDIYLAGAMRSDIFGFSLDELVKIKKGAERSASLYSSILSYKKNKDLRKKLDEFLEKLTKIKASTRKMTAYEAISYIYGRCGILSHCNSEEKRDLIKLYNMAREYEGASFKGLYSFLKHIEKLLDSKGDKSFRGDTAKENVKIMTIHSSKGLEFEVCFICDLEDKFNHSDTGEPILFQRQLGVAGYVSKDEGLAKFKTMSRKCIALQLSRDMCEEEMRILYVAMTRARSKLILVGALNEPKKRLDKLCDGKKYIKPFNFYDASSLLSFVTYGICQPHSSFDLHYLNVDDLNNDDEAVESDNSYIRSVVDSYKKIIDERINFKYEYEYLSRLPSKMSISRLYPEILDGNENEDIELAPLKDMPSFLEATSERELSAKKGTATHVFMQFCDFESLSKNGVKYELDRLVERSFISKEDRELINLEHLEMFRNSSLLKEILQAKHVIREFRFNVMLDSSEFTSEDKLKNEKVLVQGVTDCIYENQSGELILVDYKTDRVTIDNYEDILRANHSTQLLYYKKACEMMFEKPISKVLIYSVPLSKNVEI